MVGALTISPFISGIKKKKKDEKIGEFQVSFLRHGQP
jgi:hypothetical protein